jgi:hypothetical protein
LSKFEKTIKNSLIDICRVNERKNSYLTFLLLKMHNYLTVLGKSSLTDYGIE